MQTIDFPPLGRQVSCLGLGCGGLDGRHGLRRSARMIEAALELGINYFDVAPSYGTAEEALGKVIGESSDVVIATKMGQPHAPYSSAKMFVRETIKPVLDRLTFLKRRLAKKAMTSAPPANRPRYDFSQAAIQRSVEKSLQNLRRSKIDVLLAHEPHVDDLNDDLRQRFESLKTDQLISAYGVGIGAVDDRWTPFGSVWQSAWPGEPVAQYQQDVSYVFHRVIRNAQRDANGQTVVSAADLVRAARAAAPGCLLVVSASTPARLRELVEAANSVS